MDITDKFETTKRVYRSENFLGSDFKNEKELVDLIHSQPEVFARDVLEIEYSGHEKEYCISEDKRLNKNWKARVDFRFKGPKGDIYVECKVPKHLYSEAHQAVSQVLAYSCVADIFKKKVDRLILVTASYSRILQLVIKKFNLPIEVYVISKSHVMKMLLDDGQQKNISGGKTGSL